MPAGKLNIQIEQGATFRKVLTWRDKTKRPVVMTGFSALMQVRDKTGGEVLLELSTVNGRIVLGAAGKITLALTGAETEALAFAAGIYDLKLWAGAEEIRLLEGRVSVSPSVTKRVV